MRKTAIKNRSNSIMPDRIIISSAKSDFFSNVVTPRRAPLKKLFSI